MNKVLLFTSGFFHFVIALCLFFVAAKGSGDLYHVVDLPEEKAKKARPKLRLIYFFCGLISLAKGGVTFLQDTMFSRAVRGLKVWWVKNYEIEWLPFLTYELLDTVNSVLSWLMILAISGTIVWLMILRGKIFTIDPSSKK